MTKLETCKQVSRTEIEALHNGYFQINWRIPCASAQTRQNVKIIRDKAKTGGRQNRVGKADGS